MHLPAPISAILVTDPAGSVLLANGAAGRLFGVPDARSLRGQSIAALLGALPLGTPPLGAGPQTPLSWESLRGTAGPGSPGAPDQVAQHRSGATAPLEITTTDGCSWLASCAGGGDPTKDAGPGWIVNLINVAPLRTALHRRDDVMSFLSHDMRSPLSSILALIELHSLDPGNHPAATVYRRIEDLARNALGLNEQFGQVAAAETRELQHEALDPADICAVAIDTAWEFARRKKIGIDLVSASEPARTALIWADHDLLTQSVSSLLTVMARNSADGSRISVALTADHEEVSIEVAGQGEGFGTDDQEQLFARYLRNPRGPAPNPVPGAKPGQPKASAAGLELALANIVIGRHGGRIAFDNTPGLGARFKAVLPLHRA